MGLTGRIHNFLLQPRVSVHLNCQDSKLKYLKKCVVLTNVGMTGTTFNYIAVKFKARDTKSFGGKILKIQIQQSIWCLQWQPDRLGSIPTCPLKL